MEHITNLLAYLPFDFLQASFMRQAFLALLLLTPITAIFGVHVLSFRMAFFSDAVGHSAFTGLALGLILGIAPNTAALIFGVLIGLFIVLVQKQGRMGADAAIGIIFSAVVAFGLAVASKAPELARDIQRYLYGDILTIGQGDLILLAALFSIAAIFEIFAWNRLLLCAIAPDLARRQGIWEYIFAGLLALLVMFSVRAVGVLLVTALLVVPAAAARNMARSTQGMFWWSILISMACAITGLAISVEPWAPASGATIILAACLAYALSIPMSRRQARS